MSTPSKEDILRLKLERSKKCIQEAKTLALHNFTNAAISRLYYACFYAASALLFNEDVYVKTHSGVKQKFGQLFVTPGLLSIGMGKFYSDIFSSRLGSDYDDFAEADIKMVNEYLTLSEQFVNEIHHILKL